MRRVVPGSVLIAVAIFLASCGASVGSGSGAGGSAGVGANGCPGNQVSLKVVNADTWCTFEINGGHESGAPSETACVEPGTVTLTAKANPGFELGATPWHDINTANGATATVDLTSGTKCVWVCCPGKGAGAAPCPVSDQCP